MKEKYTISTDGNTSEYEDSQGNKYIPEKIIGEGSYAVARKFLAREKGPKPVAVLNSKHVLLTTDPDYQEVFTKGRFFKTIYPAANIQLFEMPCPHTYRLVLPFIEGQPLNKISLNKKPLLTQINILISLVRSLQDCHQKGLILLDLKSANVLYDEHNNKCNLIDGGLSMPINSVLNTEVFQFFSELRMQVVQKQCPQIPKECWTIYPETVTAKTSMDVYALGGLMLNLLATLKEKKQDVSGINPDLMSLIKLCQHRLPVYRPTLEAIEEHLMVLSQRTIEAIDSPAASQGKTTWNQFFHSIANTFFGTKTNKGPANEISAAAGQQF